MLLATLAVWVDRVKYKHRQIIFGHQRQLSREAIVILDNCRWYQFAHIAPVYDPDDLKLLIFRNVFELPNITN